MAYNNELEKKIFRKGLKREEASGCGTEMELLFIAELKDNELWMIGGWHWLEQRLMYGEMMQRERQKREAVSAQLDFLPALRIAA